MWFVNLCNSKFRGTKPPPFNILKNFHHVNLNELVIFFHFVDIQHAIIYIRAVFFKKQSF